MKSTTSMPNNGLRLNVQLSRRQVNLFFYVLIALNYTFLVFFIVQTFLPLSSFMWDTVDYLLQAQMPLFSKSFYFYSLANIHHLPNPELPSFFRPFIYTVN